MSQAVEGSSRLRVALVMPALNEEASVDAVLQAVRASTRLPDEIVVVDAGSTDRTRERVQAHADAGLPIRLLVQPGAWPGVGRNAGARAATSELLLFLDFGNLVDPQWIAAMAEPFERDARIEAVGGLYEPLVTSDFERCVAAIQYQEATLFARLSEAEQRARAPRTIRLGGLGMAVRRDVYLRLGGQPAWLRAGEDLLFGHKLLACQAPVAVAWGARLHHHMRRTPGELFRQNRTYARGEARVGLGGRQQLRLAAVYGSLLLGMAAAVLGWWPAAAASAAVAAAYLHRTGIRRLQRVFGPQQPGGARQALMAVVAVLAKDLGSLSGHAIGTAEWLLQPRWREQCRRYMAAVDAPR